MDDQGQEKTEQPSQRKLDKGREEGQVAKSTEISSFAVFSSGLLILFAFQGFIGKRLADVAVYVFRSLSVLELKVNIVQMYFWEAFLFFVVTLAPFFIGIMILAIVANVLQVGFKLSPKALMPKFNKLNPVSGIKRVFFSSRSAVETLKSLAKLVLIGLFMYTALSSLVLYSTNLLDHSVVEIVHFMTSAALSFLWKIMLVYAVLAIADFIFQKYKFMKDMKMTKEEVKEEVRQTIGDPQIKGKIRRKQMEISRNRMILEVSKADVVITNPTHFAIALKYDSSKNSAPIVLAKGVDEVAFRIKEEARKNNVPLYEDRPLARALYKNCEIGREIPEDLFTGVAKILAFIYRARDNKKKSIV